MRIFIESLSNADGIKIEEYRLFQNDIDIIFVRCNMHTHHPSIEHIYFEDVIYIFFLLSFLNPANKKL